MCAVLSLIVTHWKPYHRSSDNKTEAICDFALGVMVFAPIGEAFAELAAWMAACLPSLTFIDYACMVYWPWSEYGARVEAEERELLESSRKRNDAAPLLQADR